MVVCFLVSNISKAKKAIPIKKEEIGFDSSIVIIASRDQFILPASVYTIPERLKEAGISKSYAKNNEA